MTVRVDFVRVGHVPRATGAAVIVCYRLLGVRVLGLVGIECIAVLVFRTPNLTRSSCGIDLKHCIIWPVNVWVDAHAEEMLVIVRVDTWVDFGAPAQGILAGVHGISIQDTGELNLKLYGTILVEDPVHAVFVVGGSEDLGDEEFTTTSDDDGVITEVSVFEKDTGVFFVNADCILDGCAGAGTVDEIGIHVVNCALAVTA